MQNAMIKHHHSKGWWRKAQGVRGDFIGKSERRLLSEVIEEGVEGVSPALRRTWNSDLVALVEWLPYAQPKRLRQNFQRHSLTVSMSALKLPLVIIGVCAPLWARGGKWCLSLYLDEKATGTRFLPRAHKGAHTPIMARGYFAVVILPARGAPGSFALVFLVVRRGTIQRQRW